MKNELIGFDKRLTEKMRERNLSQADLCRLTGSTTSMLSYYCAGQRLPTLPVAFKLAKALHTTVEYLAFGNVPYAQPTPLYSVAENKIPYNPNQMQSEQVVTPFALLNDAGQAKVMAYIEDLLSTDKYKQ